MSLRIILKKVVAVLSIAAEMTATKIDDNAVTFINAALDNPQLIELIEALVDGNQQKAHGLMASCENKGVGGLEWVYIVKTILPFVIAAIRRIRQVEANG